MLKPEQKRARGTEFVLSMGALAVLLSALLFVFLARWRPDAPANAILVDEATATQFAQALEIAPDLAERLVAARTRVGGFHSVDALPDARLFSREEAKRISAALTALHEDWRAMDARRLAAVAGLKPAVAARLLEHSKIERGAAGSGASVGVGAASGAPTTAPSPTTTPTPTNAPILPLSRLRERGPGGESIPNPPVLAAAVVHAHADRLLARRPETARLHLLIGTLVIAPMLLLLPIWLRNGLRIGGDPYLLPLALLLSGMGVVMLYSSKDPLRGAADWEHHLIGVLLSLIVYLFCARLTPAARQRIRKYQYTWVFGAGLLVLLLLVFGHGPEGVKLYLFGLQPVEIIKLMLVFFLASYFAARADLIADTSTRFLPRKQDLAPVALLFMLSLILFYVIKDLGPGLLLFAVFIALLTLTTGRVGFLGIGLALLLAGGCFGYWRHIGVFATRVDMWLSPFQNSHPNGMQLAQSYWALGSGGWSGSGLGLGRIELIPRGQDDLAFISWTEETGLLGALLALLIYAVMIWRGVRIALRAGSDFDRALAFGLTALLALQTFLIVSGVTGLLPLTGISLPFMSFGDSALAADFALLGLLRGISATAPAESLGPRPAVVRAAYGFAGVMTFLFLGVLGCGRLAPSLLWQADTLATRTVTTPDADGVARAHQNPRLLELAAQIERGSLYDRNGRVLAVSRPKEFATLHSVPAQARKQLALHGRYYPFGPALSNLLGCTDPAVGGPSGLERRYNDLLRGYARLSDLLPVYRSRNLPFWSLPRGRDLHLSLDATIQRTAQDLLKQAVQRLPHRPDHLPGGGAAVVLLDPHTGDVIAAATWPSFDPNTLTAQSYHALATAPAAEQTYPLIDRALSGLYPPGSTLKVATTACALETLPDALHFSVVCNQVGTIRWKVHGRDYSRTIHDDKGDPAFGTLTLPPAFRVSSNIYFANLAVAVGPDALSAALERDGFHHVPHGERFDRDLADLGFGQGRMLATPMEMARLAAGAAADGALPPPHLLTRVTDPAKQEKPRVISSGSPTQAMQPATSRLLRGLMRDVVTGGTARGIFDALPFAVAGKTGTAQNRQANHEPHSWFIGFAPAEAPRYAFACVVENGGYGRTVAAAVCRDLLKKAVAGNR